MKNFEVEWHGPFQIKTLLDNCLNDDQPWPLASQGLYLVTKNDWKGQPDTSSVPLYFGGNTGTSERFCTRIGDLIADIYGLFDGGTGHHSGGQSLWFWCNEQGTKPGDLFISWAKPVSPNWCSRCAEISLARLLVPKWDDRLNFGLLNKNRPPACKIHHQFVP